MRTACLSIAAGLLLSCSDRPADPTNATAAPSQAARSPAVEVNAQDNEAGATATPTAEKVPAGTPCLVQNKRAVPPNRLRAIGTEPFWGARIEGRCVTYSHPEDQQGTRVWTQFSGTAENGIWKGALGGKPFELRTRPEQGCSDGMSDNRYPIAVGLTVMGEQRSGCAGPL